MFLLIARSGFDDVPVRLFESLNAAKAYALNHWDSKDGTASEALHEEVAKVCSALRFPLVTDISGIDIAEFRESVVFANRWSTGIQVRIKSAK